MAIVKGGYEIDTYDKSKCASNKVDSYHNIFANEKIARKALSQIRRKYWEKELITVEEFDYIVNAPHRADLDRYKYGWTDISCLKTWRDSRNYFHIAMSRPPKRIHQIMKGDKLA